MSDKVYVDEITKQADRIQKQTDRIKRNDAFIFSVVGFVTGVAVCLAFGCGEGMKCF